MTCGSTGEKCPSGFDCKLPDHKSGAIGVPGVCLPRHQKPLGKFSYQCVDGLGCHLVDSPPYGQGSFSNYQACEKNCPHIASLKTYYECGGKQGVACDGPHPGFPNAKKGRYASLAQCQGTTVCGKAQPTNISWPSWDTGVGAADPFIKIMADVGDIHDPIQNYMGERGHGPQSTHFYRPGLSHQQ